MWRICVKISIWIAISSTEHDFDLWVIVQYHYYQMWSIGTNILFFGTISYGFPSVKLLHIRNSRYTASIQFGKGVLPPGLFVQFLVPLYLSSTKFERSQMSNCLDGHILSWLLSAYWFFSFQNDHFIIVIVFCFFVMQIAHEIISVQQSIRWKIPLH